MPKSEASISGVNGIVGNVVWCLFKKIVDRLGGFIVTYRLVLFESTTSPELPFNQLHSLSPPLSFFYLFLSSPVCVVGVTLALSPTV